LERTTPLLRPETVLEYPAAQTGNAASVQSVEHTKSTEEQTNLERSGYHDHNYEFDEPLGMDIENFLPDTPEDIDNDAEPETFSKWLDLDGKQVLKASVVATLSTAFSKKIICANSSKYGNDFGESLTAVAKKSTGLPFYYILIKSASNDFIQVVDIN